jgi:hypothetical protein
MLPVIGVSTAVVSVMAGTAALGIHASELAAFATHLPSTIAETTHQVSTVYCGSGMATPVLFSRHPNCTLAPFLTSGSDFELRP